MRLDREHMARETLEQLTASGEGLRTEFKETTGQRGSRLVPVSRYVVAEASRSGCSPCRGGEGGESARLGEAPQSTNLDSGDWMGLLRRMGDAAMPETFYTFSTSTRLNKGGVVLPCRGEEAVESACPGEALQSVNLRIFGVRFGLLRRLDDVASSKAFYTFYTSTRPDKHAHFCQPFLARSTEISEIAEPLRDRTTIAECLRVSIRKPPYSAFRLTQNRITSHGATEARREILVGADVLGRPQRIQKTHN
jgi:hypothetical protein